MGLSAHCPYDNRSDCAERVSVPADPDTELFHHPSFGYYEVSGVENYVQMFGNKEFWKATWNSIYFCILTVPLGIFLSLLTAVLLNAKIRAKAASEPFISCPWWLRRQHSHGVEMDFQRRVRHYQPDHRKQDKLADQPQAGASGLCGGGSLERVGYDAVLLLSGIQNISKSYYEAASLDGASKYSSFLRLRFPWCRPPSLWC